MILYMRGHPSIHRAMSLEKATWAAEGNMPENRLENCPENRPENLLEKLKSHPGNIEK
jgi:hypothetical protein